MVQPGSPSKFHCLVGQGERAVGAALQHEARADAQHEEVHASVAVDIDRIGADHIGQELGVDVDRLLLELEPPAGLRPVDVKLGRILAASQKDRGKAGAVAVESRAAAADEELPRAVVDAVDAGRLRFFVHDRHVADRSQRAVGRPGGAEGEKRGQNAEDDPHHGASMTRERRNATTLSRLSGSSAR